MNKRKSKTKSSKNTTATTKAIASIDKRDGESIIPTIEPNVIPEKKKNECTIQQQEQIQQESVAAFRQKLDTSK